MDKMKELDDWIEKLKLLPQEYRKELTRGLVRLLGPGEMELACLWKKAGRKNRSKSQIYNNRDTF